MTTHELETGQTVIVAVVPRTATGLTHNLPYRNELIYSTPTEKTHWGKPVMETHFMQLPESIIPGNGVPIEIVGTIQHPGVFSFDPKLIVQKTEAFGRPLLWTCYTDPLGAFCDSPQASAISRLASWGYYLDNPLGEKPDLFKDPKYKLESGKYDWDTYKPEVDAWHKSESRKLSVEQMVVVIQIKK